MEIEPRIALQFGVGSDDENDHSNFPWFAEQLNHVLGNKQPTIVGWAMDLALWKFRRDKLRRSRCSFVIGDALLPIEHQFGGKKRPWQRVTAEKLYDTTNHRPAEIPTDEKNLDWTSCFFFHLLTSPQPGQ